MFVMVGWERWVERQTLETIFREIYYSGKWDLPIDVSNSIPVFAAVTLVGLALRVEWLWVLGAAALLHVVLDLPLHNDDGHPHFWPLTSWVFESPVSYWDPAHHGRLVSVLELALCLALAAVLLKRFRGWPAWLLVLAALGLEAATSVGWWML